MHSVVRVGKYRLYGGMRLLHNRCDVFYDNPLFSELLYPNPGNLGGTKTWGRYVRQTGQVNSAFVPAKPGTAEDYQRVESTWQRDAGTREPLSSLWGGWHPVRQAPDLPWLIVCPRDEIMQYWYARSLASWQHEVTQHLAARGDSWVIRLKQDRKHRMHSKNARVLWTADQYRGVITAHSVSAIDALLAGRPAIVWGQDPTCGCGTPWQDFASTGVVNQPTVDQVKIAAETWAQTTYPTLDTERAVTCVMNSSQP